MKATMTYKLAMAAGRDAGNRNMRREGRTTWNDSDWNLAAGLAAKLLQPQVRATR